MNVIMIIGEPCVGKSKLMQRLLSGNRSWLFEKPKWLPHHFCYEDKIAILGRYDEEHQFPGTDRLSMAVQPKALDWIDTLDANLVIMEGDRLGNISMMEELVERGHNLSVYLLDVKPSLLSKRRAAERPEQDGKFVQSRNTKIRNIVRHCDEVGIHIEHWWNNTPKHAAENHKKLEAAITHLLA